MRPRLLAGPIAVLALAVAVLATATPAGAHRDPGRHHDVTAGVVRLTGSQEVPPNDAGGRGTFGWYGRGDTLCYFLTAHRVDEVVGAHIHQAPPGVNGPIVVGLELPDPHSGGCITAEPDEALNSPTVLTQAELDAIIDNPAAFYTNVHTATFPGGIIRGQLR